MTRQLQTLVEHHFAGDLPRDLQARSAARSLTDDDVRPVLAAALLLLVDHGIVDPATGRIRSPGERTVRSGVDGIPARQLGPRETGGLRPYQARPAAQGPRPAAPPATSAKREAVASWWSQVLEVDVVVAPRSSMKLGRMSVSDLEQAARTHRGTATQLTQRAEHLDVLARLLAEHRAANVAALPPRVLRERLAAFAPQLAP